MSSSPRQAGDTAKQADNAPEQAYYATKSIDSVTKEACQEANQGCNLKKPVRRTTKSLSRVTKRTNCIIKEAAHHSLLTNFTAKSIGSAVRALEKKIRNLSDL